MAIDLHRGHFDFCLGSALNSHRSSIVSGGERDCQYLQGSELDRIDNVQVKGNGSAAGVIVPGSWTEVQPRMNLRLS